MKVIIDGIRYDTSKCDLVAKVEEQNPRGRDTGFKVTSLFRAKDNKFLLCLDYVYKGRSLAGGTCVKVSPRKAFEFAEHIANLDVLEAFFPLQVG